MEFFEGELGFVACFRVEALEATRFHGFGRAARTWHLRGFVLAVLSVVGVHLGFAAVAAPEALHANSTSYSGHLGFAI